VTRSPPAAVAGPRTRVWLPRSAAIVAGPVARLVSLLLLEHDPSSGPRVLQLPCPGLISGFRTLKADAPWLATGDVLAGSWLGAPPGVPFVPRFGSRPSIAMRQNGMYTCLLLY
jgi:hypothetical protein